MRGVIPTIAWTFVCLSLTIAAGVRSLAAYGETGQLLIATNIPAITQVRAMDLHQLKMVYAAHTSRRSSIAAKLNALWMQEHELSEERDEVGRAGDIVTLSRLERDLLATRQEINSLRTELTSENRLITLIEDQLPD
jgi:hypothetical protein